MDEVFVKVIDMDTMITEQIVLNMDGTFTILLNSRMTVEKMTEGYCHAIMHILNNDFDITEVTADTIETKTHYMQ